MKSTTTRHTCDTARSGSERSENTCAACHEEMARSTVPRGFGDLLGDWERQRAARRTTQQPPQGREGT